MMYTNAGLFMYITSLDSIFIIGGFSTCDWTGVTTKHLVLLCFDIVWMNKLSSLRVVEENCTYKDEYACLMTIFALFFKDTFPLETSWCLCTLDVEEVQNHPLQSVGRLRIGVGWKSQV